MREDITPGRAWSTRVVALVAVGSLLLGAALATAASLALWGAPETFPRAASAWAPDAPPRWIGDNLTCQGGIFCQLPIPFEQGDGAGDIVLELTKATLEGTDKPTLALEARVRGVTDVRLEGLAFTLSCFDDSGQALGETTHQLLAVAPVGPGDTAPFLESVRVPSGTMRVRLVGVNPELTRNPPRFEATPIEPTWKARPPLNTTLTFRIRERHATDRQVRGVLEVLNQGPATLTSLTVVLRNAGGGGRQETLVAARIFPPMLPGERRVSSYSLSLNEDVGQESLEVIEVE